MLVVMKGYRMRKMLRPQLLSRMQHLLKGGLQPPPRWVRAAEANPPAEVPPAEAFRARGGKGASAPETRLVDAFLERNPTYKGVAIDLLGEGAEYVPLAFARRQVRLMEGGMTEAAARDLLEKEMGLEAGGREQYAKQCRDTLRAVQNEEEAALRTALVSARKMEEEARAAARRGPRAT